MKAREHHQPDERLAPACRCARSPRRAARRTGMASSATPAPSSSEFAQRLQVADAAVGIAVVGERKPSGLGLLEARDDQPHHRVQRSGRPARRSARATAACSGRDAAALQPDPRIATVRTSSELSVTSFVRHVVDRSERTIRSRLRQTRPFGSGSCSYAERFAPLLDDFGNALGDLFDRRADGLHVLGRFGALGGVTSGRIVSLK